MSEGHSKTALLALAGVAALAALTAGIYSRHKSAPAPEDTAVLAAPQTDTLIAAAPEEESHSLSGQYLASHFAQSVNDWTQANEFLGAIIAQDGSDSELVRRSMILATGSGDMTLAAERARQLTALEGGDGLALMILAVDSFSRDDPDTALGFLDQMPAGDMTDFVKPLLRGWAMAAKGELDVSGFNETAIHRYHAVLIAILLNRPEQVSSFGDAFLKPGTLATGDIERAADILAAMGRYDEAVAFYEGLQAQDSDDSTVAARLEAARKKDGDAVRALIKPYRIKTARQGAALAMYDMAYILYQEHSDSSTRLFASMALALDPALTDAHLILADTLTRNGRMEDAIVQLDNIPPDHPSYLAVQRHSAELLAEVGRTQEALETLEKLFTDHNDVESLIRIGDLYRHDEDYKDALAAYNRAAGHIGGTIPEEYWYLLYARGMAYEREGDWSKAESDLKAAMVYRPNHPYLLNYLGYGWADQGLNLQESLELIKRAVALLPSDGYIIDSLGWVEYMMKDYDAALPNLESAVELLPYDSTINDHLGDVYWRKGRKVEARFQWERARNYSEEEPFREKMDRKLRYGLEGMEDVRQAGASAPAQQPEKAAH